MIAVHQGFTVGEVETAISAAAGRQQQVRLGAHSHQLSGRAGGQVPADVQPGAHAFLRRVGSGWYGNQPCRLPLPDRALSSTDTQQRPVFIAAGILVVISVLLLLVGFLAELIVSQGARITELERYVLRYGGQRRDQ